MLETVASGPSVRRTDLRNLCYEFLGNIVRQSEDFANLGFANRDGVIECMGRRSEVPIQVRDRDYFHLVMATPRFTVGSFILGRVSRAPSLGFGMPVYDDSARLLGVAFAAVDVRRLAHAFQQLDLRPDLHVTLLDRHGVLLATNLVTGSLYGDPRAVLDAGVAARKIARVLPELSEADVQRKLESGRSFVWLKRNLTPRQQQQVNALGIPGVEDVRQGKYIEVKLAETDEAAARAAVDRMCRELLANMVIENYAYELVR